MVDLKICLQKSNFATFKTLGLIKNAGNLGIKAVNKLPGLKRTGIQLSKTGKLAKTLINKPVNAIVQAGRGAEANYKLMGRAADKFIHGDFKGAATNIKRMGKIKSAVRSSYADALKSLNKNTKVPAKLTNKYKNLADMAKTEFPHSYRAAKNGLI